MTILRVLIADDHPLLRDGLRAAVNQQDDMEVVGEASTGSEAIMLFESLLPDALLLDIEMPGSDGLSTLEDIRSRYPAACVVMLTSFAGDARVVRALKAGALGYLLKSSSRAVIIDALRSAASGQRVISSEISNRVLDDADATHLNNREVECIALAAEGLGNREIAEHLSLSTETVKTRLKSVFLKLGAHDRAHAVSLARDRGYI